MRIRRLYWTLLAIAVWGPMPARCAAQDGNGPSGAEASIEGLRSEDVEVRRASAAAVRMSDKQARIAALPVMIEILKGEKDGQVRLAVLDTVTALGPDAAPAVPALVQTLRSDYGGQFREELHQDYRSALALAAVGKPAVEGLRSLLGERKANVRAEVVMALGRIGPDAEPAIPDLIRLLGDESDRIGGEATLALGRMGAAAIGPLLEASSDERAIVRARAVEVLGHLAGAGDRVRVVVVERTRDASPGVRAAALKGLVRFDLPEGDLSPILAECLADEDEAVRLAAINLLVGRRELLSKMAPRLTALLAAEHDGVARHAAFLLQSIGIEAAPALLDALAREGSRIDQIAEALSQMGRPVVGLLTPALAAADPRVRSGAALALGQVRPLPSDTVDRLTAGLGDPDAGVRAAFLGAVGQLGPSGTAAVPAVRATLRDESAVIRVQAIDVLVRSAPRDDRLLADLAATLDDTDPRVQRRALLAIRSLGPLGRAALAAAIEKLESPDLDVRVAAAELIGTHGPAAAGAVPALSSMLEDPSPEVRAMAAQTLGSLGKAAQPTLPRLTLLLKDQPSHVRTAAALTLGSLELDAEAIRPPLAQALRDDEPEVRRAALRAIQRLGPRGALFIPDLILLADNREERRTAERSLRRFERTGPDPRSVPDLVEHLGHEQEAVRLLAIKFLGLAGPSAKDAIPALDRLRDDPSAEVRQQAEAACERIKNGPGAEKNGG